MVNLNQIIDKIKYPRKTAGGTKYYVEVEQLKEEIKKAKNPKLEDKVTDLEQQRLRNGGLTDQEIYEEVMADAQTEQNAAINDYLNR